MKTLTELSGSLVRTAAAAIAEARRSLPREEAPVTPAVVVAPAPAEAEAEVAPAAEAVAEAPAPKLDPDAESDDLKAILDEAVAKATSCSGERLIMLRAAVKAVGRRTGDVRLVRVFGVEEQLRGAQVFGERQYVVDYLPTSMKQVADAHRDDKGKGKGRGGRGGGGGGGGGDRGAKGSSTGGFSMDSLKDDRKNDRGGGRGGGPRRPGGPGGPPKK
ncbi:MAG: translation initiation factor 2 [Deltaproteobacteria bacterium]